MYLCCCDAQLPVVVRMNEGGGTYCHPPSLLSSWSLVVVVVMELLLVVEKANRYQVWVCDQIYHF